MTTIQVTIDLPEEAYQRAERFARLSNLDLSSILIDTVVSSFPPLSDETEALPSLSDMSDQAILDLANSTISTKQDQRLSKLLEKQREGELVDNEAKELEGLMQIYNEGWLRKTTGLAEAVRRGLMEPMHS